MNDTKKNEQAPKADEKPQVLETQKLEDQGNRADSCARCAGSKFC